LRGDAIEFAASIVDRHAGAQAANGEQRLRAPPRRRHAVDERQVRPGIHAFRKGEVTRHDADDARGVAVLDPDRMADDIRGTAEETLPQRIADHHLAAIAGRPVLLFLWAEGAPQDRSDPERREQRRRRGGDRHGLEPIANHPQRLEVSRPRQHRDACERAAPSTPVEEGADRDEASIVSIRRALGQQHESIGILVRQRLEQHGIDDGEHGRVGADTERERENRAGRERRRSPQRAGGIEKIAQHGGHYDVTGRGGGLIPARMPRPSGGTHDSSPFRVVRAHPRRRSHDRRTLARDYLRLRRHDRRVRQHGRIHRPGAGRPKLPDLLRHAHRSDGVPHRHPLHGVLRAGSRARRLHGVRQLRQSDPFGDLTSKSTKLVAVTEVVSNPLFNQAQSDSQDIAVLLVDPRGTRGIPAAALPPAGLLDQLSAQNGLKTAIFTAAGYGLQNRVTGGGQPFFQDANPVPRMFALSGFNSLNGGYLRLSQNPSTGNGGTCFGDSGGPNFLNVNGVRTLVAITITGDSVCRSTNVDYRLDTASARAFLAPFVALP
jgi:hypothetical protein